MNFAKSTILIVCALLVAFGDAAKTTSAAAAASGSTSAASSSPSSSGSSSGGSSSGGPTYDQFCAAAAAYSKTTAGGSPPKPSQEVYNQYMNYVASAIPLKEQAMFLANSIWETGGLQYVEEIACKTGSCTYGKYYGRGYMQLTWDYNYKAASQEIYKDDRLVTNPALVAQPEGAWRTAIWFWTKNVSPAVKAAGAVDKYELGHSIKKINGALECPANDKAKNRLAIYNAILDAWGIAKGNPGTTAGC